MGMGSYSHFAWEDAFELGQYIAEKYTVKTARRVYANYSPQEIREFAVDNHRLITEFLRKTKSQRPAFLRRISAQGSEAAIVLFLILCVIATYRVHRLIMDAMPLFSPGRGKRITISEIYYYARKPCEDADCEWPRAVFDSLRHYRYDTEEDED